MKEKNTPSLKRPEVIFLSFFGVGFSPWAPGTMGTLATLPFLYFLGKFSPPFFLFIPFLIIATFASCVIAEITQKKLKLHDPGWIVMDEVLGMATTWLFYQSSHWSHLLVMFILFRAFDIFKVWPATFFDKKVTHGYGTIIDDIVSGIYAGAVYYAICYFNLIPFS
ncbi:phosphatidylglycerophosphatase A [Bacteriovoracaceae bacterium]|nr:phosphatidylglycerophosphatase A [Bacteriovoracaceae bacterium]